jgi:hypothetical protein
MDQSANVWNSIATACPQRRSSVRIVVGIDQPPAFRAHASVTNAL